MTGREEAIKAAELEIMESPTRHNPRRLRALLHEDFVEIGRSRRRWTRDEIVASLTAAQDRSVPPVDEWAFVGLSTDLILATYRVRGPAGESRHASVWDTSIDPLQIRFHQGTVVASAPAR